MELRKRLNEAIRLVPDFPKPGILFKDICPLFLDHQLCKDIAEHLATEASKAQKIDAICAIESRGFFLGILMAQHLQVPLFPVRKKGKLPAAVRSYSYELEYGSSTLEIQQGIIKPEWNVLVHDDILATGGTAIAASELIKMEGGNLAGFSFIDILPELNGVEHLKSYSPLIVTV